MKRETRFMFRRFLALLICVIILAPSIPLTVLADTTDATETNAVTEADGSEEPLAVVYAASDFQLKNSAEDGDDVAGAKQQMLNIVTAMQNAGYTNGTVDGALFCGDYSAHYNTSINPA